MQTSTALRNPEIEEIGLLDRPPPQSSAPVTASLRVPDFGADRQIVAQAQRVAARLNAGSISKGEREELLRERQELLDKKFNRSMTRCESNRLEYVRWTLDRIEDAETGEIMDRLENYVVQYEILLADIKSLTEQLEIRIKLGI